MAGARESARDHFSDCIRDRRVDRSVEGLAAALQRFDQPFFVIDGTYGVSGAQPPEAFAQIARQVWAEKAEKQG